MAVNCHLFLFLLIALVIVPWKKIGTDIEHAVSYAFFNSKKKYKVDVPNFLMISQDNLYHLSRTGIINFRHNLDKKSSKIVDVLFKLFFGKNTSGYKSKYNIQVDIRSL